MEIPLKDFITELQKYNIDSTVILNGTIEITQTKRLFQEVTPKFVLTTELKELLNWDLSNNKHQYKIVEFVNTLLSIWNPNTDISTLNHTALNNTTLSKAVYISKTKGKYNTGVNIDSLINKLIEANLDFLKWYYNKSK